MSYTYTYDTKDRRTQLNMADGTSWVYGYDDNGQIISGVKHDATGKAIPGQSFGYAYDGIGNLTAERRGIAEMSIAYTANSVNQYASRAIPGVVPIIGEADAAAAVKVIRNDTVPVFPERAMVPVRSGKYFQGALTVNNSQQAKTVPYTVYAIKEDTVNNKQLVHKETGSYTVPKASQPLTYDLDGNTTGDGIWAYTWNGENRLAKAEEANSGKVEFSYDYMGRRVEKRTYSWISNAWSLASPEKYAYNGWNLIAVYDGNDALQKSYLWGIDLSGSLQGAGGVGGLLAENSNSTSYYPAYDGNGNGRTYVDTAGASVADYEYGPFGQTNSKSGTKADDFVFGLSTKPLDKDLNIYFYNVGRGYSPDTGRWISRDPIEENDGPNIYAFVKNNPMSKYDVLGMWGSNVHYEMTKNLARKSKYPNDAAERIGQVDNGIDGGPMSFLPIVGDQSYHFNKNKGGIDSRQQHFNEHLAKAKSLCSDANLEKDNHGKSRLAVADYPEEAAANLGAALHAKQDIYAHGDFDVSFSVHNSHSPLTDLLYLNSDVSDYPDDIDLDAAEGGDLDGKPTSFKYSYSWGIPYPYAKFKLGRKRINATERETKAALENFRNHIKQQKKCCKCREYFGANNQ